MLIRQMSFHIILSRADMHQARHAPSPLYIYSHYILYAANALAPWLAYMSAVNICGCHTMVLMDDVALRECSSASDTAKVK